MSIKNFDKEAALGAAQLAGSVLPKIKRISSAIAPKGTNTTSALSNGMVKPGAVNKAGVLGSGSMMKTAMSGQEYDKEAVMGAVVGYIGRKLGGLGAKGLGTKVLQKSTAMKETGLAGAEAAKNLSSSITGLRGAGLGIKGRVGSFLANTESKTVSNFGQNMLKRKRVVEANKLKTRLNYDKQLQINKDPNSDVAKRYKKRMEAKNQGGANTQGGGRTTTQTQNTSNNQIPNIPNVPHQPANNVPGGGRRGATTPPPTGAVPGDGGLFKNLSEGYKKTDMYANYGHKPLIAAGGLGAYAAGGGVGGSKQSPIVISNSGK